MNDDWRIHATLANDAQASELSDRLGEGRLEHELETGAGERVIVSVDDHQVFLYAGSREQAERASRAIEELAAANGWKVETELQRWHPTAEEWKDPDVPLPRDEMELAVEHEDAIEQERIGSRRMGFSEYEVRVQVASHHDSVALAARLAAEGIPCVRRWHYVLIGAADEDAARALADQISAELPAGSTVTVEASLAEIRAETPANPFAVFGGLGG